MAKMIVMCGDLAVGKTTYAKEFAAKTGYRYLSIDDLYTAFNGSSTDRSNKFDIWMIFLHQIHLAEQAGQNIIVDVNAPTQDDRNDFLNWFPNFDHYLVFIRGTNEQCLENNRNRERVVPEEQMKEMFRFFRPPYKDEDKYCRSKWKKIIYIRNVNNVFERQEDIR